MHLCHHDSHPEETYGDVKAVRADKSEEGREECASGPAVSFMDKIGEFRQFHGDKRGS